MKKYCHYINEKGHKKAGYLLDFKIRGMQVIGIIESERWNKLTSIPVENITILPYANEYVYVCSECSFDKICTTMDIRRIPTVCPRKLKDVKWVKRSLDQI